LLGVTSPLPSLKKAKKKRTLVLTLISSTIVEASGQDSPARAVAVQRKPGNLEAQVATP
jgi:hypothetical protein